jgi:hypothetical protein
MNNNTYKNFISDSSLDKYEDLIISKPDNLFEDKNNKINIDLPKQEKNKQIGKINTTKRNNTQHFISSVSKYNNKIIENKEI